MVLATVAACKKRMEVEVELVPPAEKFNVGNRPYPETERLVAEALVREDEEIVTTPVEVEIVNSADEVALPRLQNITWLSAGVPVITGTPFNFMYPVVRSRFPVEETFANVLEPIWAITPVDVEMVNKADKVAPPPS